CQPVDAILGVHRLAPAEAQKRYALGRCLPSTQARAVVASATVQVDPSGCARSCRPSSLRNLSRIGAGVTPWVFGIPSIRNFSLPDLPSRNVSSVWLTS